MAGPQVPTPSRLQPGSPEGLSPITLQGRAGCSPLPPLATASPQRFPWSSSWGPPQKGQAARPEALLEGCKRAVSWGAVSWGAVSWVLCPWGAQARVERGEFQSGNRKKVCPPQSLDFLLLSGLSAVLNIRKNKKCNKSGVVRSKTSGKGFPSESPPALTGDPAPPPLSTPPLALSTC